MGLWLDASYVGPLRVVTSGARAYTHLAQIRIGAALTTGYVKAFGGHGTRLLFNEVAGSVLARQAGIGTPPGGLMWDPHAVLLGLFPGALFAQHRGNVPCFAVAPVSKGYGVAALGLGEAVSNASDTIRKHLLAWPGFAACAAFDEWVANVDRHVNNLLLIGPSRIVPIDHSDCFGGSEPADIDFTGPEAWYLNKLLELLFSPEQLPLPTKAALVHAGERLPDCHRRCIDEIEALRPWLGEPTGSNWVRWLDTRATLTAQWLRDRVRMLA